MKRSIILSTTVFAVLVSLGWVAHLSGGFLLEVHEYEQVTLSLSKADGAPGRGAL